MNILETSEILSYERKIENLTEQLAEAKELLKFYYNKYEFCGTASSPNWKVKEKTEKLLEGEKKEGSIYPTSLYIRW